MSAPWYPAFCFNWAQSSGGESHARRFRARRAAVRPRLLRWWENVVVKSISAQESAEGEVWVGGKGYDCARREGFVIRRIWTGYIIYAYINVRFLRVIRDERYFPKVAFSLCAMLKVVGIECYKGITGWGEESLGGEEDYCVVQLLYLCRKKGYIYVVCKVLTIRILFSN